jgi:hypothetical protein
MEQVGSSETLVNVTFQKIVTLILKVGSRRRHLEIEGRQGLNGLKTQ